MKKLQSLGRSLSKDEQKRIMGGYKVIDDGGCDCGCTNDNECGIMVCSKMVVTLECGRQTCPNIHQCVPR